MFARPLVGHQDELHLVALLQDVVVLHLGRVEEQLLALFDLVAEESELPLHGLDEGALLLLGGLDVHGELAVPLGGLKLHRIPDLQQLLLVLETGDGEGELAQNRAVVVFGLDHAAVVVLVGIDRPQRPHHFPVKDFFVSLVGRDRAFVHQLHVLGGGFAAILAVGVVGRCAVVHAATKTVQNCK